jgi:hypothetical protein
VKNNLPLHEREVALHPLLDTALSELKGGGVLRISQRRALIYSAGELIQDDDECEPSARGVCPPVKLSQLGLFEEGGEQLGYLLIDLWSSLKPAHNLPPQSFGIGIIAWGEPVREDLLGIDDLTGEEAIGGLLTPERLTFLGIAMAILDLMLEFSWG